MNAPNAHGVSTLFITTLSIVFTLGLGTGCQHQKHLTFDMPPPWGRDQNSEADFHLPLSSGGPADLEIISFAGGADPQRYLREWDTKFGPTQTVSRDERTIGDNKVYIGRYFGPYTVDDFGEGWTSVATLGLDGWTIQIWMDDDVTKHSDAFDHLVRSFKLE